MNEYLKLKSLSCTLLCKLQMVRPSPYRGELIILISYPIIIHTKECNEFTFDQCCVVAEIVMHLLDSAILQRSQREKSTCAEVVELSRSCTSILWKSVLCCPVECIRGRLSQSLRMPSIWVESAIAHAGGWQSAHCHNACKEIGSQRFISDHASWSQELPKTTLEKKESLLVECRYSFYKPLLKCGKELPNLNNINLVLFFIVYCKIK